MFMASLPAPPALVMPGLDPGIHVFGSDQRKTWMAGTSPAMTTAWTRFCLDAIVTLRRDDSSRKCCALRLTRPRLQRVEALLQGRVKIVAGLAEAGIAGCDEITLGPAQDVGGTAARIADQARIGIRNLMIERTELRIGADRPLHREAGRLAIEGGMRLRRVQRLRRCRAEARNLRLHGAPAFDGILIAGVEAHGRLIIGQRLGALAHLVVEHGAVVIGECEVRIELQRRIVVVERSAELALELVRIAAVGEEVRALL